MTKSDNLTVQEAKDAHYSRLVGLIKERNRPSGGIRTIHTVAVNSFLDKSSRVLEIGSNTGFTSVNIAKLCGCKVVGIDLVDESLAESEEYKKVQEVQDIVEFKKMSATDIGLDDESFDLVWASNVTSFIDDKNKAISEYLRVLKDGGYLAFIPIYYRKTPPKKLVDDVGKAISADLKIWSKEDWLKITQENAKSTGTGLELCFSEDYLYLDQGDRIEEYCDTLLAREHLKNLDKDVKDAIADNYINQMKLFNENLLYCGYSIFIYQKRKIPDEEELFLTAKI